MARITGFIRRLFHRPAAPQLGDVEDRELQAREEQPSAQPPARRNVYRASDIPMETIENTYTPPLTSSKASFRSDGSDHERDQDFITRAADDRWNDEDRLTNKSGDPRIGTHGRRPEQQEESNG